MSDLSQYFEVSSKGSIFKLPYGNLIVYFQSSGYWGGLIENLSLARGQVGITVKVKDSFPDYVFIVFVISPMINI